MIYGNSTVAPSLLRMRDICKRFSVSPTTVRRATTDGSLRCLILPSNHRRFREQDVLEWLGVAGEESNGGGIPIAAVIRVSSKNQNRPVGNSEKSSLDHQEERVRDYIQNRWGDKARVTWYRSCGSGMNFERKEFLQLIQDVLAGKFKGGFIVATDFTRVCRFGIKMVEFLAAKGGCQIAYSLGSSEEKDENETLTDEIMSILTHYTAKASGQKNKAINQTQMTEDQLRDAYLWYKSGFSYRAIADRLTKEGRGKDEKGRVISRHVVKMRMKDNWAVLEKMYGSDKVKNSFVEWAEKYVRKSRGATKISRKRIVEVYQQWCKETKRTPLSCRRIGTFTKQWRWDRSFDSKGSVVRYNRKLCSLRERKGGVSCC